MSESNFQKSLSLVLLSEGGYVNDPRDPGGATNKGITQKVYDAWRRNQKLAIRGVKQIDPSEVASIYREQYWRAAHCEELPSGVDYAVFDTAVMSGVVQAMKLLQASIGTKPDGAFGILTRRAVAEQVPARTVKELCARRMSFLHRLRNWGTFGRGWTNRVDFVRRQAIAMASSGEVT